MNDKNTVANSDITSGRNSTVWLDSNPINYKNPLTEDVTTDVLIIGGGIAGLTTAYLCLQEGKKAIILEDGYLCSGETGRTTAHLSTSLDDRYFNYEKYFGEDGSKLAAESHSDAIDEIEKIIQRENIDCDFKRINGYLFLHASDELKSLTEELDATQRAGIKTEMLTSVPGFEEDNNQAAIKFPNQGRFHVLKYLTGLKDAIINLGGKIYTHSRAENISETGAEANGYSVKAEQIVVCTNSPINDFVTMHTKQHAYRTYVVGAKVKKDSVLDCLWWDTGDQNSKWPAQPYHYVRLQELDDEYDLIICGGEDHKTGQEDDEDITQEQRYENLESWTKKHFPHVEDFIYRWSGQVMEPIDSLGYMGKNPGDKNIFIITGDSGNGMTHSTIGAMIIRDEILGRNNKYAALYDPARITLKAAGTFIEEGANMAKQYLDWVSPSDLKDAENLESDQGGILTKGLNKIAVFKNKENNLQVFSAVCPHMGCVVHWNSDEKSFDCPCHGSRFDSDGKVMNGPAQSDLKKMDIKE